MIKHTMSHLGPAVSAERMLQDYVNILYRPAAVAGRRAVADSFAQAKALAAWTSRIRAAWPQIQVEHVDSVGVSEDPQIGDTLQVNAYIALHDLDPDDVVRRSGVTAAPRKATNWPMSRWRSWSPRKTSARDATSSAAPC